MEDDEEEVEEVHGKEEAEVEESMYSMENDDEEEVEESMEVHGKRRGG